MSRGSPAERGLGAEYRQQQAQLGPPPYGSPCPRCGKKMLEGQPLDTGHEVDRALGGEGSPLRWEHRACNRGAGGRLGSVLRRAKRLDRSESPRPSRRW